MRPKEAYQNNLKKNGFVTDHAQKQAVDALQLLYDELIISTTSSTTPIKRLLCQLTGCRLTPVKGLYIWGSVGRGKTWLMNLFYQTLPFEEKLRLHFHHFMLDVHEQLAGLHGRKNPLTFIAKEFALKYRVICLDEFIVTNITDAMLLSGLLEALFNNGVALVATSNRVPDDLYKNGLQRERFLPAIALIRQHTHIMHMDGKTDHRIALLEQDEVYYTPITEETDGKLKQRMEQLAPCNISNKTVLTIHKRPTKTLMHADEILFLENGRVVERGTHAALLATGGRYAALHALQSHASDADLAAVSAPADQP